MLVRGYGWWAPTRRTIACSGPVQGLSGAAAYRLRAAITLWIVSGSDQEEGQGETVGSPTGVRTGLAPRQARQLRIAAASVLMAGLAVVLAVRLASRSSVLVVGVYGLALILCGVVIELSRRGRTRLGTWVLGAGLAAALAADRFLIP